MTRGERAIVVAALEASTELPIIRIEAGAVRGWMHEWARPAERVFQHSREDAAEHDCLRAVQPEIRHVALLRRASRDVQRPTDDERARLGDRAEGDGDVLQKTARLAVLVLQPPREVLVDGTKHEGAGDESTSEIGVVHREERNA